MINDGLPPSRIAACGLTIVACWLPWMDGGTAYAYSDVFVFQSAADPNVGWFGTLHFRTTILPDWLVAAAALFVMLLSLLAVAPQTIVPRWLPLSFAAYAFLHVTAVMLVVLLGKTTPGTPTSLNEGWWLAFLSLLCVLVSLLRKRKTPIPLKAPALLEEV